MLLFLILLLPCTNHAFGLNPAIKAVLASKGLKYGTHIGTDWMHEKILSMKVPDVTGGVYIGFGTVKYVLDGISVSSCDVPEPSVNFSEGSGLKIVINGLSIAVRGNWHTTFGIITDGGSFDLAVFNLDLTLLVDIGSDDKGHMSILSKYCSARINSATINFHGGASWIFQPFVDCFKSRIKALIEEKICPLVDQHVADLEQYLTELQVSFQIDPIVVLDVPLTNAPLISSSSLGLDLKGEFYSIKSPKEPPFEAKAFDLFNSASYAYFDTGHLHITVTDEMVSHQPLLCLPKLFPNMLMLLEVYAREIPMFSFLPGEVTLDFPGAVKALAILPNRTLTPLFKLNADSLFSGKVYISEGKLKGLMELKNFTLTLASSEIGTFQTAALEKGVNMLMKISVLSVLNAKLKEGIALPTIRSLNFVNSVLKVQQVCI
uniref:Bactericidal permeability-increasing protein n=1 Tax=Esox lucius TaxID=8010 RepID=A0A3P8YAQ8_ESOLU